MAEPTAGQVDSRVPPGAAMSARKGGTAPASAGPVGPRVTRWWENLAGERWEIAENEKMLRMVDRHGETVGWQIYYAILDGGAYGENKMVFWDPEGSSTFTDGVVYEEFHTRPVKVFSEVKQ